jgi:hypothetical protein
MMILSFDPPVSQRRVDLSLYREFAPCAVQMTHAAAVSTCVPFCLTKGWHNVFKRYEVVSIVPDVHN